MRNFENPGRSLAVGRQGMAATSHPDATLTAVEILKAGGNAIDAAVAACAVQCVVEAGSTGIGGDCFAMLSLGGGSDIRAYNGSGRTPRAATLERYREMGMTAIERHTPHAVTVPGAIDAWARLVADHGRMSLTEIFAPAIAMARQGYLVTPRVAYDLGQEQQFLLRNPALAAIHLDRGKVPAVGTCQSQPLLANTLEAIAREGRDAFYRGEIARDMAAYLASHGGFHHQDDFAEAGGEYVTPISTDFRGRTVYECPPNGQGVAALLLMNILSTFEPSTDLNAPEMAIREIEATRLAYSARDAFVGDSDNVPVDRLLSKEFAAELAARIDVDRPQMAMPSFDNVEHSDTVYITVVDKDRNAVSFINSLFQSYGSGLMEPKSGVLFHNRGMSFSLKEGHNNVVGPRKRPLHTIIPALVTENGRVCLSFGVMGGHYQAMGHACLLSRVLDHGLDLQTAIDMPRYFPVGASTVIETEATLPKNTLDQLVAKGYELRRPKEAIGGAQAIAIDWERNILIGGSDCRKDGLALGY